jgi:Protein of unknown function (DUF3617)
MKFPIRYAVALLLVCSFALFVSPLTSREFVQAQNGPDPAKPTPLDVKPGLWELHLNQAVEGPGVFPRMPRETMDAMEKNMTAEQRVKFEKDLEAQEVAAEQKAKKGTDRTQKMCPLKQEFESKAQINFIADQCTRTMTSTGQALHIRVACRAVGGNPEQEQTTDFERVDAENFKGVVRVTRPGDHGMTITQTWTARWISDTCAGPPAGTAGKRGERPVGMAAIADLDPNRVVAVIDGKDVTARDAWNQLKKVAPGTRSSYAGGTPALLSRLYLQNGIADEAVRMHLDKQEPWKSKLAHTKQVDIQGVQNYAGDPNIPPEVWAHWVDDQQHILYYNAYFAQVASQTDKQALLAREKDKYKVTVKDAEFFSNK